MNSGEISSNMDKRDSQITLFSDRSMTALSVLARRRLLSKVSASPITRTSSLTAEGRNGAKTSILKSIVYNIMLMSKMLSYDGKNKIYVNTLPQAYSRRQAHNGICPRPAILKKVNQDFPDLRIVGRGTLITNPFANEPCDTPFDNRITMEENELPIKGTSGFTATNFGLVSRASAESVCSTHCWKGMTSFKRMAQRPMAQ